MMKLRYQIKRFAVAKFNLVYAITLTMVKKYITYTKKDHEITRRAFLTILKMKP